MSDSDRQRMRMRMRQRQASQARPQTGAGPSGSLPDSPNGGLNRRAFLAGLGAVAGGGVLASYSLSGRRSLPEPRGQAAGPEYRAATLALQPAPRFVPGLRTGTWNPCSGTGAAANPSSDLDLALVIDTTGSMGGVIGDVKTRLAELLSSLASRGGNVRVGLVAYRDYHDAYIVRSVPLTALSDVGGVARLKSVITALEAAGGEDWPEAMAPALDAATSMEWRGDVPATVVVIADAPPHPYDEGTASSIVQNFQSKIPGGRVSLIDTGSGGNAFMRSLPARGGGKYVTYDGKILNSLYPAITGC